MFPSATRVVSASFTGCTPARRLQGNTRPARAGRRLSRCGPRVPAAQAARDGSVWPCRRWPAAGAAWQHDPVLQRVAGGRLRAIRMAMPMSITARDRSPGRRRLGDAGADAQDAAGSAMTTFIDEVLVERRPRRSCGWEPDATQHLGRWARPSIWRCAGRRQRGPRDRAVDRLRKGRRRAADRCSDHGHQRCRA